VLAEQPGELAAAASVHAESLRVAAYAVPRSGATLDRAAIRFVLAQHLPPHMIPAFLDELVSVAKRRIKARRAGAEQPGRKPWVRIQIPRALKGRSRNPMDRTIVPPLQGLSHFLSLSQGFALGFAVPSLRD
jgi:anti-sigma factor ChrR (cupin superfamily)